MPRLTSRITTTSLPWATLKEEDPGELIKSPPQGEERGAHIIVEDSMAFNDLDPEYPEKVPFYLYGNSRNEVHIGHVLRLRG
ncbi:hypothetical protein MFIFM68171_00212 [Madurella fahalii]|uniref:Uncharacterized protein n=1 Tax=Madurella fahalii TaxID=1157608 RepID=A0ABQ0FWW7_9PEZI